jgi:hypothetical protein
VTEIQALKKCDKVVVNDEKKLVQIKLQPSRSRLIVKAVIDEKKTRDLIDNIIRDQLNQPDIKS